MTADYHKNDISLNEALAILLYGPDCLWEFRQKRVDLLEDLERTLAHCALEYEEAVKSDNSKRIEKCRLDADKAAAEFDRAGNLYSRLCEEVTKIRGGRESRVIIARDEPDAHGYDLVLFSRQSFLDWADAEGVRTTTDTDQAPAKPEEPVPDTWEGVELTFRPHHKLFIKCADGSTRNADLIGSDLLHKRNHQPTTAGTAFLGLATRKCIPHKRVNSGTGISSKVMSGLRDALQELTGISGDPFYDYDKGVDGWKPRFRVIDRRRAGDEREKEKAVHLSYQDELYTPKSATGFTADDADEYETVGTEEYPYESGNTPDAAEEYIEQHSR